MHIKGSAYQARQNMVRNEVGEERWQQFIDDYTKTEPLFAQDIQADSDIPIEPFLKLNDAIIEAFFDGDIRVYWRFGEESAQWAFEKGPYHDFFDSRNYTKLIADAPLLWSTYYDEGEFTAVWIPDAKLVEARIAQLPVRHAHFEYTVMGYMRRSLELTGAKIGLMRNIKGFVQGDDEAFYLFYID